MSMSLQACRHVARPPLPLFGARLFDFAALTLVIASYLPVFSLYARQQWTGSSLQGAYGHAWLALMVLAWLLWRQRGIWASPDVPAASRAGWFWLFLGVGMKLYGEYHAYDVLRGVSLVPTLAGLAMLRFGMAGWRRLRFPILFLLFVIPMPDAAIDAITRPLLEATSVAVRGLLPFLGLKIEGAGQHLLLADPARGTVHELILAPECSGVRSLVALFALASLISHLQGLRAGACLLMLPATLLLTLAGNTLRVSLLALGMVHVSPEAAETAFHTLSGVFLFVIALSGLLVFSHWLPRRGRSGS